MITKELLKKYKVDVESESYLVESMYQKVLDNYLEELNDVVDELEEIIKDIEKGVIDKYSNEDLERVAIKIPLLMYRLGGDVEKMGLRMDVTSSIKEFKENSVLVGLKGTGVEKKANAEMESRYEKILENVYKRVYRQIDRKLDYIDNLYSSIKKVMSLRIVELEVFRREGASNNNIGG